MHVYAWYSALLGPLGTGDCSFSEKVRCPMFRWFERWLMCWRIRKALRRGDLQEALEICEAVGGDPARDVWIPEGKRCRKRDDPFDARYCYTQAQYVEGLLAVGDACAAGAHRSGHRDDSEYARWHNREDAVESYCEALRIVRWRLIEAGDSCYQSGEVALGDKAYETARMDILPEKLRVFIESNIGAATKWHGIYASERGREWQMYMNAAETFARRLGEKEWTLRVAMLYLCQGDIDKAVILAKDAGGEIPAEEFRATAADFLEVGELQIALQARSAIGEDFSREEILLAAAGLRREGTADDRKKAQILEAYVQGMEKR